MRVQDIPDFGNLAGAKVLFAGHTVAVPFAAELLAEHGAKCICLENPKSPDSARRGPKPYGFLAEHRNELCMDLDVSGPEGRDAFLAVIATVDIFMEAFKPGAFARMGLSDEELWKANPRLSIVHVSGFGQTGLPEYVSRTSFDPIGQAFSGYMVQNGYPDGEPLRAAPYTCDYVTALFAAFAALTLYVGAQRTGRGDSMDVTQFESMMKIQYRAPMAYFLEGDLMERYGNAERDYLGLDLFRCLDGGRVFVCVCALGPVGRLIDLLGISDHPLVADAGPIHTLYRGDPVSEYINAKLISYCLEHTAADVDRILNQHGIPCSMVNDMADLARDPHVEARGTFAEWNDARFGRLKGIGIVPQAQGRPGRIWDGARDFGQDTRDILAEAGLAPARIDALFDAGACREPDELGGYAVARLGE